MAGVDAGLVLLPRLTALVGATSFVTAPLDLSQQGGTQFQVWRGPIRVASGSGTLTMYMEESLDCQSWALGPFTPPGIVIPENDPKFFSYDLRLRWFRVRFVLAGTDPMVVCWAGGLLREGGGGGYGSSGPAAMSDIGEPAGEVPAGPPCKSRGTVREVKRWYQGQTRWVNGTPRYFPPAEWIEFTDGRVAWRNPPRGYDVIDLHNRLWPACGGGPIPVDRHGNPLPTGSSSSPSDTGILSPPTSGGLVPSPVGAILPRIPPKAAAAGIGAMGLALRGQGFQAPQFPPAP